MKEVKEKRKNILSSNSLNTSVPSLPISPNSSLIMTMKKQFLGKFTFLYELLKILHQEREIIIESKRLLNSNHFPIRSDRIS